MFFSFACSFSVEPFHFCRVLSQPYALGASSPFSPCRFVVPTTGENTPATCSLAADDWPTLSDHIIMDYVSASPSAPGSSWYVSAGSLRPVPLQLRFFSSPKVRSSALHGLPFICMEFLYWTYRSMFISIWTSSADVSSSLKVSCHKLRTVSFWYGTIRHLRQLDFLNIRLASAVYKRCAVVRLVQKSFHLL